MMLGSSCSPCCSECPSDGKQRTDPKDEGTWVPSGTWRDAGGVTWTFQPNPGDESGETWFFYGSDLTSKKGGRASIGERRDWGNICNWYSNKTTAPSGTFDSTHLSKRATRLPPDNATVHIYSSVSTISVSGATVARAYFWSVSRLIEGVLTATETAHDSAGGAVFNNSSRNEGTVYGGATFNDGSSNLINGTVYGGATFNDFSNNNNFVYGGATFNDLSNNNNFASVYDGATFNHSSINSAKVYGGATFNDSSVNNNTVFDSALFNDSSVNNYAVYGGAAFNNSSGNSGTVYGDATFNDFSLNHGLVDGSATFNGESRNNPLGRVNGGAMFNDAACSLRIVGFTGPPCNRKFVAHPSDLPVCNGTAPKGCDLPPASCGCG